MGGGKAKPKPAPKPAPPAEVPMEPEIEEIGFGGRRKKGGFLAQSITGELSPNKKKKTTLG